MKLSALQVDHFTVYGLASDSEEDPEVDQDAVSKQVVSLCLRNNPFCTTMNSNQQL